MKKFHISFISFLIFRNKNVIFFQVLNTHIIFDLSSTCFYEFNFKCKLRKFSVLIDTYWNDNMYIVLVWFTYYWNHFITLKKFAKAFGIIKYVRTYYNFSCNINILSICIQVLCQINQGRLNIWTKHFTQSHFMK